MKSMTIRLGALILLFIPLILFASPAMAQTGQLSGQVFDLQGKPYPGVVVTITSKDTGVTHTMKTDKDGRFLQVGVLYGTYSVNFKKAEDKLEYTEDRVNVSSDTSPLVIKFKDIAAKSGYDPEAEKKKEEAEKKFKNMKALFDSGRTALTAADALRDQIRGASGEQFTQLQAQRSSNLATAVSEFQQAQQAAPAKDPNLPVLDENLAAAYASQGEVDRMAMRTTPLDQREALQVKITSEYTQAATTLQQAIDVKPTAGRYMDLGTYLAYAGKMSDASAACDKAAGLSSTDATSAEGCYKNIGIVLSNSGNMKDAVAPLQKATQLNPKDSQAWYLLGSALLNTIGAKQQGDKMVYEIPAGTAEAFQKYLDLEPNGPYAADAKGSLQALQQMGGGIATKENTKKKKNN